MCVFLFEVTYETKCIFLCCLVEIIQFDGQNFYGSQGKDSVRVGTLILNILIVMQLSSQKLYITYFHKLYIWCGKFALLEHLTHKYQK